VKRDDAPLTGLPLVLKAIEFAARKHRDQRRKDKRASPYINHPIALANVLWFEGGVTDPVVLAAALLHDTLEDTETSWQELRGEFGDAVAEVVLEVTDVKWLKKDVRKRLQVETTRNAFAYVFEGSGTFRDASEPRSVQTEQVGEAAGVSEPIGNRSLVVFDRGDEVIVQAGVHFMAETSKLLNPDKTVLIPDLEAGCSLAASITAEDVGLLRAAYPGVPIVTYVNTSAAVKAECETLMSGGSTAMFRRRHSRMKMRIRSVSPISEVINAAMNSTG